MRTNLIYILIAFLFVACQKEATEYVFDKKPEERMAERNQELRSKLVSSADGWKVFIRTSAKGSGYGFYMKFNQDETVTMYSDWNNATATTSKTSTYSIRFIMNTSLIFDTYNYIGIMQDPQGSVNGGTQPNGLQSDIEFEYIRSSGDSIVLRGKKYQNLMYMLKATASEASEYNGGSYLNSINSFKNYFLTKINNYVAISSDGANYKMGMVFSPDTKTVSVQAQKPDKSFVSAVQGFGYSIDGAFFTNAIEILNIKFVSAKQKDANTMVLIDSQGKEYPVLQNPVPLADLIDLFGSAKTYNSIYVFGSASPVTAATLPPGVTSDFSAEFNGLISRFAGTSRTIDTLEFRLLNNTTALVKIWYWSGTTHFLADASFNYTYVDGTITLTNYTPAYSNANWTTRIAQIGSFVNWLQSGPFKADWVSSSIPGSPTLAGLYKKDQPNNFFYGRVRKQ